MRSLLSRSLLLLATSLVAVKAFAIDERSQCLAEICGEPNFAQLFERQAEVEVPPTPTVYSSSRELTNAERLARGLPLKPPTRRKKSHVARAQASPVPSITYTGYIQVMSGGNSLGYINQAGGMLKYTTDISQAIHVAVTLPVGETSGSQLDITMLNANGPLLGLVQGRDDTTTDLQSGSFQYLYVTGIALPGSEPGATPATMSNQYSSASGLARAAESSVWSVNVLTGVMDFQWINSDGSSPSVTAFEQGGYLYAGGDVPAFASRYSSPIVTVYFHFVPSSFVE